MAGLIADSHIALSSLRNICDDFKQRINSSEALSVRAGCEYHDLLCIAMETKFQYLTFERGKQVAVLDIAVVDRSLTEKGTSKWYIVRLSMKRLLTSSDYDALKRPRIIVRLGLTMLFDVILKLQILDQSITAFFVCTDRLHFQHRLDWAEWPAVQWSF